MTLNARSVTDHASDKIEKMNTLEYIQKCGLVEKFFRIFMMGARGASQRKSVAGSLRVGHFIVTIP